MTGESRSRRAAAGLEGSDAHPAGRGTNLIAATPRWPLAAPGAAMPPGGLRSARRFSSLAAEKLRMGAKKASRLACLSRQEPMCRQQLTRRRSNCFYLAVTLRGSIRPSLRINSSTTSGKISGRLRCRCNRKSAKSPAPSERGYIQIVSSSGSFDAISRYS